MPRYQPSWCQDDQADAKIPAAAGAKMPRYQPSWCQDIKIPSRARPSGALTTISLGCLKPQNRPFWYQNSNMSICHENKLFIIQKLYLHGAKATKISIFWHPESPRKQLSSQAGAKMPRYQPSWCQDNQAGAKIAAAAGAKMPRYQPSWCQDIKIPSRARPSGSLTTISLLA